MQKKLIAVAVAGVLAAPLALAQTNVTISGTFNAGFENIGASGGSLPSSSVTLSGKIPNNNRVVDNSSEVRFTVEEDLGGGLKAFGTIGNQVDMGFTQPLSGAAAVVNTWGSRNTGVGLRSSAWGEIVMGRWDVQWHTLGGIDSHWIKGAGANSLAGASMTMGQAGRAVTQGGRQSNVVRYTSPTWNGFNVTGYYGRNVENNMVANVTAGGPNSYAKDTTWSITPMYNNGPWHAVYSYYARNDQAVTVASSLILASIGTVDTRGHRAGLGYTFGMGVKLGIFWDRLKAHETSSTIATGTGNANRTVWGIPVSYTTGAHSFGVGYVRMGAINASASVAASNVLVKAGDNNTGAHMWSLGYQYALSKRTNLWLNYAKINNGANAAYDFGANNAAGLGGNAALIAGGVQAAGSNAGADPRTIGLGMRHVF